MTRLVRRRLRVPLGMFIAGTVLAGAWAIGGGTLRWWAIAVEAMVLGWSVACYVWAGEDNDEGALAGSRADERQKLVGQRARALAGVVAMVTAFAGLAIAIAAKVADAWPFGVLLLVTSFSYVLGLSLYGSSDPDVAEDADASREPSPVSR